MFPPCCATTPRSFKSWSSTGNRMVGHLSSVGDSQRAIGVLGVVVLRTSHPFGIHQRSVKMKSCCQMTHEPSAKAAVAMVSRQERVMTPKRSQSLVIRNSVPALVAPAAHVVPHPDARLWEQGTRLLTYGGHRTRVETGR